MSIIIPCSIGIGTLGCISLYHLYLNSLYKGTYRDKLYYLNSHIITLTPIIFYLFIILDELFMTQKNNIIQYFYIEWIVSTPLMLKNIGRFTLIPLNYYIYIILLDYLMILCGYISYITTNNILNYVMYGGGCICYIIINILFLRNLKIFKEKQQINTLKYRIFNLIYFSIATVWIVYPIIHILLKTNNISINMAINGYIVLDILSKGVFTSLMLGSRELYQIRESYLKKISRKIFRIHPLEINTLQESIEEIKEIVSINNENNENNETNVNTINPYSSDNTQNVSTIKTNNIRDIIDILNYHPSKNASASTITDIVTQNTVV